MDYPHGHHPHHGPVGRRDEEYPPPGGPHPPTPYGVVEPPPPQLYHTSHTGPRPDTYHPPPPPAAVDHPHHRPHAPPHFPATVDHRAPHKEEEWARKPSVKTYCKAETGFSLTVRDGKIILARSNPSDPSQHWIKDDKYSTRVKDEEGFPSFALVNKATGLAMKHSIGATQPVQLIPYNPDILDESILWTESKDLGDGYRAIRMVNNIRLNVDAFNGDKNHGGVHDGTAIVLWEWKKGDNQRWKIVPH